MLLGAGDGTRTRDNLLGRRRKGKAGTPCPLSPLDYRQDWWQKSIKVQEFITDSNICHPSGLLLF